MQIDNTWAYKAQEGPYCSFTYMSVGVCVCLVGQLFSWGCNSAGQLGIGLPVIPNSQSASGGGGLATQLVHCVDSLRGVAIAHIAAGSQHSAALSVSGALFMWGFNRYAACQPCIVDQFVVLIIFVLWMFKWIEVTWI